MSTATDIDILGLFPSLDQIGGVQASGREAWSGIVQKIGPEKVQLFSYRPGSSKVHALFKLLTRRCGAKAILVWHLHLLRLLPFVNGTTTRVILFLHGIEAWKRHDALTRFWLRRVSFFVSNSEYTWNRFIASNPEFSLMPHRIVHLGVKDSTCDAVRKQSQKPVVLMISRLVRSEDYKGHRQMIEAWPLVQTRVPEAELWIAGEGDLRLHLEELARSYSKTGTIRFPGRVSEVEKEQLLEQCSCLALPSSGEGFGLVYLEAMRAGRPCLVSTVDAGREVVNPPEAGLAVNPNNPSELAAAVLQLITPNSDWWAWSLRARHRYEKRFTTEHFRQRLLAALSEN